MRFFKSLLLWSSYSPVIRIRAAIKQEFSVQINALVGDISSTSSELTHMATLTFQAKLSVTQGELASKIVKHQECLLVDTTLSSTTDSLQLFS